MDTEIERLKLEIARLSETNVILKNNLAIYGGHKKKCPYKKTKICDCGYLMSLIKLGIVGEIENLEKTFK